MREKEAKIKTEETKDYNRRHAVKELSNLSPNDRGVYISDRKENAVVVAEPRSYHLDIDSNVTVRRNRRQLNPNPKEVNTQ